MNNKKYSARTLIICVIAFAVLIGIGFSLNRIIGAAASDNKVTVYRGETDYDNLIYNGETGQAFIQVSKEEDTIGLKYTIYGGSFIVTDQDNSNRRTDLLLKNIKTGKIYKIETDIFNRPDVYAKMCDQYNLNPECNYGFYAAFSPVLLKQGIYEAFIATEENEKDKGIFYVGEYYCKDGTSFDPWRYSLLPETMVDFFGKTMDKKSERAYASGVSVNEEQSYAWNLGDESELYFKIGGGHRGDITCTMNIISVITDSQHIIISSQGQTLLDDVLKKDGQITFAVPSSCIASGVLTLHFDNPDSIVPKEAGINADTRQISVAYNKISFA